MLLSIVVPIYKVEAYLEKCLLSIVNQNENICEAILVDDGSPDSSGAIADEFAKKYKNMTVIHKENGGLSDARNVGISVAKGEYVLFLDSDDSLVPGSLDILAENLRKYNPQVAFINMLWVGCSGKTNLRSKQGLKPYINYSGPEALKKEFCKGSFYAMAQGCVCRREFLVNNHLLFKKGIMHEDEQWTPRVMLSADSVVYFPLSIYQYMIRENSITTSGDKPKNGNDIVDTSEELYEIYSKISDRVFRNFALRYNAKLCLKGLSILIRCKKNRKLKSCVLFGKWVSLQTVIRSGIFVIFPRFYAHYIDYKLIKGRK